MKRKTIIFAAVLSVLAGGAAYSLGGYLWMTEPVEFYAGHTHGSDGKAIDAPEHSGGTTAAGCHNASVPFHCH